MRNNLWQELSPETFLKEYWQKKPRLFKRAFLDFEAPLKIDEIAGLSMESEFPSRLVLSSGGEYPWQLKLGPFSQEELSELGDEGWNIMVSQVDKHVPEVAQILDHFSFVPRWRLDDVMISCAPGGAGVGAHTDSYDVFLIQGEGTRRWEIASEGDFSKLVEGIDVQMIENFEAQETFILEPGDMLYLPPGVAHNGVNITPGSTYSVGFIAPTREELVEDWVRFCELSREEERYQDPDLTLPQSPFEIRDEELERVAKMMAPWQKEGVSDDFVLWFGEQITRRGTMKLMPLGGEPVDWQGFEEEGLCLARDGSVRWSYYKERLFAGGASFVANKKFNQRFFESNIFEPELWSTWCQDQILRGLLESLLATDLLYWEGAENWEDESC